MQDNRQRKDISPASVLSKWLLVCSVLVGLLIQTQPSDAMLKVPVTSVAQVNYDEEGRQLNYPTAVFFDPVMEETYLVHGGEGTIIVYGPDYFPRLAIDKGRGVIAPQAVFVTPDGDVYISQVKSYQNPSHKITILNGAFFPKKEIIFDEIEEATDFRPHSVTVNDNGRLYVSGENERGVLVFDEDGEFLHRLQPMDDIEKLGRFRDFEIAAFEAAGLLEEKVEETPANDDEGEVLDDALLEGIPEEFRPKKRTKQESTKSRFLEGVGPVRINFVTKDNSGKLYLVSAETGAVYVYSPNEEFLFSFGRPGGSPGQMSYPTSLAVDENKELIYVVDYMRHTVLVYNLAGIFITEIGGRGGSAGYFNFPRGIAINNSGEVIITDIYNKRFQVLEVRYDDVESLSRNPAAETEETTLQNAGESDLNDRQATTDDSPAPAESPKETVESVEEAEESVEEAERTDSPTETSSGSQPEGEVVPEIIIERQEPAGFSETSN